MGATGTANKESTFEGLLSGTMEGTEAPAGGRYANDDERKAFDVARLASSGDGWDGDIFR